MHFVELRICEKVGKVLEECNRICPDSLQLLLIWMDSETFERILDGDVALCSQAKSYIARSFMNENRSRLGDVPPVEAMPDEALFWLGYLITYWCLEYQEMPKNILRRYDMESIAYSYETLHSLSIKSAIEKMKEDYFRG